MSNNKTNTTSLTDEQFRALFGAGCTVNEIEKFAAQLDYRRTYNSRPDVREKRKAYNKRRNERMKVLRTLLNEGE